MWFNAASQSKFKRKLYPWRYGTGTLDPLMDVKVTDSPQFLWRAGDPATCCEVMGRSLNVRSLHSMQMTPPSVTRRARKNQIKQVKLWRADKI